jgi:hypothetical protein
LAGDVEFTYARVRPSTASSSALTSSQVRSVWLSTTVSLATDMKMKSRFVAVEGKQLDRPLT